MRILTIGDLHGRNDWMEVVYQYDGSCLLGKDFDKVVFMGDYFDSFDKTDGEILNVFHKVIQLKKDHPNNVVLLVGNHELSYLNPNYRCSGFRFSMAFDIFELMNKNADLFQFAYQLKNHLWTHAGVHRGWWQYYAKPIIDGIMKKRYTPFLITCENVADQLNLMYEFKEPILFMVGHDRGGTSRVGGPLWVHKTTLYNKGVKDLHQIVGHTPVSNVKEYSLNYNSKLTFVDCVENKKWHFLDI